MEKAGGHEEKFKDWSPLDIFLHIGEHIAQFYDAGPDTQVYYLGRYFPDGPEAFARALPFALTALEVLHQDATDPSKKRLLEEARTRLQLVADKIRKDGDKPPVYPPAIELRKDRSGDASHIINAHNYLAPRGGYRLGS